METQRQQKVSRQIQRDIAEIPQRGCAEVVKGSLVSVTTVRISPDLSYAKIYVSVFPFEKSEEILSRLKDANWMIRKELGSKIKHQLRIVPNIEFFVDDSLEYIEGINRALNQ